jgi:translocation and assembly module TamB
VLALALVALIILSTGWFQRSLERRVIAALQRVSGGRVEMAGFRFRPWVFRATLEKLVIHGREAAGEPPLISARQVVVHLSPEAFLRQRLQLRSLDIDGLEVHLETQSNGTTNLPGPRQQTSAQERLADLLDLSIERLTVSHSAFFWNNQRQPFEIDAGQLAILLRLTHGRYAGTLSSPHTAIRSVHWNLPPVTLNTRFEIERSRLLVPFFAWQSEGSSGQAAFTILPLATPEITASFQTSANLSALARVFRTPEVRGGKLETTGLAIYRHGEFSLQGRLHARQVQVVSGTLGSGNLEAVADYALQKRQLEVTNLTMSLWGGTARGTLRVNLDASPALFQLDTQLHQILLEDALSTATLAPLLRAQVHPAAATEGTLKVTWAGRLERLEAAFDLAFQGPLEAPRNLLTLNGHASGTLAQEHGLTLHLTEAQFHTPHSMLTAQGTLAEFPLPAATEQALRLTFSTTDFEEWRPLVQSLIDFPAPMPLGLKSPAEFTGQWTGSIAQPSIEGRLKVGKFQYHGWTWDRLAANVTLTPSFVEIASGRVYHEKSSFQLDASAQLDHWRVTPASSLRLSAQAQRTPLEGLKAAINLDFSVQGVVTGRIEVSGPRTNLTGSGTLRIADGAIGDEPFDSFTALIRVERSTWKLTAVQVVKGHGRMSGDLTLEPERHFASGQMRGVDFRLTEIRSLPLAASEVFPKGAFEGRLSFEARGQGTLDDFHLLGAWQIHDLTVAGTLLGEMGGVVHGEGQQLRFEGQHQGPAGSLKVQARVTAAGDWPLTAEAQCSDLRIDPWIRAFFSHEFAATVILGGSLQAAGPLRTPEKMNLRAETRDLAVSFPSLQWKNVQPIDLRYSQGTLEISRFVMRGPSTELEIAGAVHFAEHVTLALTAEGKSDATLLTALDPNLQATGRSVLHLRLTGSPLRPEVNGTLDIQDVSVGVSGLPFRLNNLQGTVQLEGGRAVIRSVRGASGGGTVTLSGFATLLENPRLEVRADLEQVRIPYPPNFTSVLDGQLRLTSSSVRGELQGDLIVRQMFMKENVNWLSKMIESANPFEEPPAGMTSPLASNIRLNVRVISTPPVQVETRDMRVVGDVDVRLQGTLANPVQVGSVHLLSGEAVFRGNRYKLARGDMSLTNPLRTQAYLDLEAETRVQSYQLTLDITGPFERLKFAYRSDPPLPTTDILSLLALGYVRQESAFGATGGNPTASVGASAILSEALSSQTTSRIQHLFGVSRIKIDPNAGLPGYGSGARVTVEEQVAHDFTMTYVTNTASSQYKIIQFEWAVSDKVSVLGLRDQNGIFGLEFRFRHRFK